VGTYHFAVISRHIGGDSHKRPDKMPLIELNGLISHICVLDILDQYVSHAHQE